MPEQPSLLLLQRFAHLLHAIHIRQRGANRRAQHVSELSIGSELVRFTGEQETGFAQRRDSMTLQDSFPVPSR